MYFQSKRRKMCLYRGKGNWEGCCCCYVTSVVSDSVRPHRQQPTRLPRPWDSPGKNTGVGCHFLLQCLKMKSESEVAQSCPTLSDPMDCSIPGSFRPWDFPGKSTGVGCCCLLWLGGLQSAKRPWLFIGWVLARKEKSFLLLVFDILIVHGRSPFWSLSTTYWGFCLVIFYTDMITLSMHNQLRYIINYYAC